MAIGFVQYGKDADKPASKSESDYALDAFFKDNEDNGRWTSEEIVYELRETVKLTVSQVFSYMTEHHYRLERQDDRLVWVIDQ